MRRTSAESGAATRPINNITPIFSTGSRACNPPQWISGRHRRAGSGDPRSGYVRGCPRSSRRITLAVDVAKVHGMSPMLAFVNSPKLMDDHPALRMFVRDRDAVGLPARCRTLRCRPYVTRCRCFNGRDQGGCGSCRRTVGNGRGCYGSGTIWRPTFTVVAYVVGSGTPASTNASWRSRHLLQVPQ